MIIIVFALNRDDTIIKDDFWDKSKTYKKDYDYSRGHSDSS